MTAAVELYRFCSGIQWTGLPENVRSAALDALCNIVAVGLVGADEPSVRIAATTMSELGGPEQAQVLGLAWRGPVDRVAFLTGIAAHTLEFDDTHIPTLLHPSPPVIAGLWALGQWKNVTGEAFLAAWVAGLEVSMRAALALGRQHYDIGWHVTGTAGAIGAAAGCATLLGLNEEQFANCLGAAATFSSGIRENFGTMTKTLHAAGPGMHAVQAALLASNGWTGGPQAIDGKRGLLAVMSTEANPAALVADLGSRWDLLDNRVKPYACGQVSFAAIDGARILRDERHVRADDIEEIVLKVPPIVVELTGRSNPANGTEATLSIAHSTAVGLLYGEASPAQFTDAEVANEQTAALRRKIRIEMDPALGRLATTLEARATNGQVHVVEVTTPRGSPENPMSSPEVNQKFRALVEPRLGGAEAAGLLQRLRHLQDEKSFAAVASLAAPR